MKPAIIGGKPEFDVQIPIFSPSIYKYASANLIEDIRKVLESNKVTNVYHHVREFEKQLSTYIGVADARATSSCTLGLTLTLRALNLREKEILLPSFTFSATAHAAKWNGCKLKFVDCDPNTFNLSIDDLRNKITKKTAAIFGVHIFGNPCNINELTEISREYNIPLIFDAAHALGSTYNNKKIGCFGDAEVFSLSPTKLITTMEGGLVTTGNAKLAEAVSVGRNYGNLPDYTCNVEGLNARMPEINAILGLSMIKDIDLYVKNRNSYADLFKKRLASVPGISFQKITPNSTSAYKDFSIMIDEEHFGMSRDSLYQALLAENIVVKKYFYPPLHKLNAYKSEQQSDLPNTEHISNNILCLPIYNQMDAQIIEKICSAILKIYEHRDEVKRKNNVL